MNIQIATTTQLLTEYNKAAVALGEKTVKRFADKNSAQRRTQGMLDKLAHTPASQLKIITEETSAKKAPAKKATAKKSSAKKTSAKKSPGKKSTRKSRVMRFVFRPENEIKKCKGTVKTKSGDKRPLRQRAVDMLLKGATFKQVEELVEAFDKDRKVTSKNVERRAYELVRLIHYYLGYGLKQKADEQKGDLIIAYTDPKDYE